MQFPRNRDREKGKEQARTESVDVHENARKKS